MAAQRQLSAGAVPPVPAAPSAPTAPPAPAGDSRFLIQRVLEYMEQGEGGELPDYEDFGTNLEQGMSETTYIEKENDKKFLFAMAICLAEKHVAPFLSWNEPDAHSIAMPDAFMVVRVSYIKRSNTHLVEE